MTTGRTTLGTIAAMFTAIGDTITITTPPRVRTKAQRTYPTPAQIAHWQKKPTRGSKS